MVAVLFARADSIYKAIGGLDVFDDERDARTYSGDMPVVAHPPCRAWGRLRHFARPRPDEKQLAFFAVDQVRRCGGVLEHPECSSFWVAAGLPRPGAGFDAFGGWTLCMDQHWLGHRARKRTWLYVVGVRPVDMPALPLRLDEPTHVIATSRRQRGGGYLEVSKREREATPPDMAAFLIEVAKRSQVKK